MNNLVSIVTDIAAGLAFIPSRLAVPFLRLGRLTRLRSLTRGHIPVSTRFDGPVRAVPRASVTLGEHCRLGRDVLFETPGDGRIDIAVPAR